jgi:hypothetical protein
MQAPTAFGLPAALYGPPYAGTYGLSDYIRDQRKSFRATEVLKAEIQLNIFGRPKGLVFIRSLTLIFLVKTTSF